jgi:hypothetical protein
MSELCENYLCIEGPENDLEDFLRFALRSDTLKDGTEERSLHFNRFVPIPAEFGLETVP